MGRTHANVWQKNLCGPLDGERTQTPPGGVPFHPKVKVNGLPPMLPVPVPRNPVETNSNAPLCPSLQLNVLLPFQSGM
jgi:hypothetical protein